MAEKTENLATDLANWVAEFNAAARRSRPAAGPGERRVRGAATAAAGGNLYTSAKVPVAAAVYGPSQVGKSLFMGQVLLASSDDYSPLGRDEQHGPPAYYKDLSFDNDLNPQTGSNEATALVTRFTTKDRIAATVSPEYPVMVRALTRAEWLRVLARGFHVECHTPDGPGSSSSWRTCSRRSPAATQAAEVDRHWRMDLLDAFSYMRNVDRRGFPAKEAVLNGLLSRYPLSDDGYVAAAADMFWDNWPSLTNLFLRISNFLKHLHRRPRPGDPHALGRRAVPAGQPAGQTPRAPHLEVLQPRRLDRFPSAAERRLARAGVPWPRRRQRGLETIQAAMLELVLPVLPHRLNDDWRKVIEQMDFLDVPGMRAGRQGAEQGKRTRPTRSTSRWKSSSAARWPTCSSATPKSCRSRRCCCCLAAATSKSPRR